MVARERQTGLPDNFAASVPRASQSQPILHRRELLLTTAMTLAFFTDSASAARREGRLAVGAQRRRPPTKDGLGSMGVLHP